MNSEAPIKQNYTPERTYGSAKKSIEMAAYTQCHTKKL